MKYKGEIELKIELLESFPDKAGIFRFSVRDTGIGIAPENLNKVLEAFSQEDASISRRFGGTGLGLAIVTQLLALMDSQLQLNSTFGEGSTFYFDLKLRFEVGQAKYQTMPEILHLHKILVVDDNANSRNLLSKMLKAKNREITLVKNGAEALDKLSKGKRYDVILIDHQIPFMNGLQIVKKIRKKLEISAREQEIILLSDATDDVGLQEQCVQLNISQRIAKPIYAEQLFETLTKTKAIGTSENTVLKAESDRRACKVLIAEDNEVNAFLVRSIVENLMPGACITEAVNGKEAVELYKKEVPHLIFMDIQMPVFNGYEASTQIRLIEKNGSHSTKIVALTANTSVGEKEKCLEAGMNDYMSKPINQEGVKAILARWL